jgi:hypothetical protein
MAKQKTDTSSGIKGSSMDQMRQARCKGVLAGCLKGGAPIDLSGEWVARFGECYIVFPFTIFISSAL